MNPRLLPLVLPLVLSVGCMGPKVPKSTRGPVTPAAARPMEPGAVSDLLRSWKRGTPKTFVVGTETDAVANGLAAAMAPLVVDWSKSDDEGFLVHNVELAANPTEGWVLFGSARIPRDGVERVEWLVVRDRNSKGKLTRMGHGQLRVVFREDSPVKVVSRPLPLNGEGTLRDLVFSWEAWRPPGAVYDLFSGLDAESYSLTVRCYAGPSRFLRDAVNGKPWDCFPLKLPRLDGAESDQLLTFLLMGDGIARRVMTEYADAAPATGGFSRRETARLLARLHPDDAPEDPLAEWVRDTDRSYQLIERSCITMALAAVDFGVERTAARHGIDRDTRLEILPDNIPDWIYEVPHRGVWFLVRHAPNALWFMSRERQMWPGNSFLILERAGLLRLDGEGDPVLYRYDPRERESPYGSIRQMNMM